MVVWWIPGLGLPSSASGTLGSRLMSSDSSERTGSLITPEGGWMMTCKRRTRPL